MMVVDGRDVPESVERAAEEVTSDRSINKKRLESLLLDDLGNDESVKHIVDREVTVVSGGTKNLFGLLSVLILFAALALGAGYYFLTRPPLLQPPENQQYTYVSQKLPIPARPEIDNPVVVAEEKISPEPGEKTSGVDPVVNPKIPLFTVTVGPFINAMDLQQATSLLQELGLQPEKFPGRGQVTMIRLLEGVYPEAEGRIHLEELKRMVKSAFLLPIGDKLAVYAGSFHQESQALKMQDALAREKVTVSLVDIEVTMNGTLLAALKADQQTASEVATHLSSLGLNTQILEKN